MCVREFKYIHTYAYIQTHSKVIHFNCYTSLGINMFQKDFESPQANKFSAEERKEKNNKKRKQKFT